MRPAALFPFALALGALILAPRPGAYAQDPRQEGPIEIEKCQTIDKPGSYKLVNNLTFNGPSGSACLSITANFVTLDLAGFTITGISQGDQPRPSAIEADGNTTGITVRNGSISGNFQRGVSLGGDGSIVEGLHVSNDAGMFEHGIGISATGIVRNNAVVGVSGKTALEGGRGIVATGVITGNYTSINETSGIEAGQGSTVIGNTATNNAAGGIGVSCPSNVTDNTAIGNQQNLLLSGTGCNNTNNVAP
jgi:hypothetical protein